MIHVSDPLSASNLTNVQTEDIQPNAVDLRIDKILQISSSPFVIDEQHKSHRLTVPIDPDASGYWHLDPGVYEIVMQNEITVGDNEAGWVITRSTLNRNGVFITSGLYDSGYHGKMAGALHVTCGPMTIQRGTRVGQFLLFKAQMLNRYSGSYGLHSQHDQKYQ